MVIKNKIKRYEERKDGTRYYIRLPHDNIEYLFESYEHLKMVFTDIVSYKKVIVSADCISYDIWDALPTGPSTRISHTFENNENLTLGKLLNSFMGRSFSFGGCKCEWASFRIDYTEGKIYDDDDLMEFVEFFKKVDLSRSKIFSKFHKPIETNNYSFNDFKLEKNGQQHIDG